MEVSLADVAAVSISGLGGAKITAAIFANSLKVFIKSPIVIKLTAKVGGDLLPVVGEAYLVYQVVHAGAEAYGAYGSCMDNWRF